MTRARPTVTLAMRPEVLRQQFDAPRLARIATIAGETIRWLQPGDPPAGLERTTVLVTSWGAPVLDGDALSALPGLKAVFHAAGTVRSFATDELWARGIPVTSAAAANAVAVSEFAFASIVLANKRAQFIARHGAGFHPDALMRELGEDCSNLGRRVGVVGFSRTGQGVVRLLQQLEGVEVLVADPYAQERDVERAGARLVSLADMLPAVHVISLHAPELPETRGMLGAPELAAMRAGAVVVNTARGSLIDTVALDRECASGRLYAVLDVTDPEPLPEDSPLWSNPNISITPHLAGSLGTETRRMADAALLELERWIAEQPPVHLVRREDLRFTA